MSSKDVLEYMEASIACISEMKSMANRIERIAKMLMDARKNGNTIYLIGNGGSGSTASHIACDLNKTSIVAGSNRFRAVSLVDNMPVILAWSNDVSYEDIFKEQLENFLQPNDIVIAVSGSGNSKNIIKAVSFAKTKGAKIIGLTGFNGGKLKQHADECLIIPSNEMYRIEDMHLMINHILTSVFIRGHNYP
ncbi:MAG: D-sedoheptulose-7-phosphate isomerase [Nitrososphaerales archaeon]